MMETTLVFTSDGNTAGVAQSGTNGHTVDLTVLSGAAGNLISSQPDGGVFTNNTTIAGAVLSADAGNVATLGADNLIFVPAPVIPPETPLMVTTDGNAAGVSLSGTADHTLDLTLLSADLQTNGDPNLLDIGVDGGLLLSLPLVANNTTCSVAVGDAATAGLNSVSVGGDSSATTRSTSVGCEATSILDAVAVGYQAAATGVRSTVVGEGCSDGGNAACYMFGNDLTSFGIRNTLIGEFQTNTAGVNKVLIGALVDSAASLNCVAIGYS